MDFKRQNLVLSVARHHESAEAALQARTDEEISFAHLISARSGMQLIVDFKSSEDLNKILEDPMAVKMEARTPGFYTVSNAVWELGKDASMLTDFGASHHQHSNITSEENLISNLIAVSRLYAVDSVVQENEEVWELRLDGGRQEVYIPSQGEGFLMLPSGKRLATFVAPVHYPAVLADMIRRDRQNVIEQRRQREEFHADIMNKFLGGFGGS